MIEHGFLENRTWEMIEQGFLENRTWEMIEQGFLENRTWEMIEHGFLENRTSDIGNRKSKIKRGASYLSGLAPLGRTKNDFM